MLAWNFAALRFLDLKLTFVFGCVLFSFIQRSRWTITDQYIEYQKGLCCKTVETLQVMRIRDIAYRSVLIKEANILSFFLRFSWPHLYVCWLLNSTYLLFFRENAAAAAAPRSSFMRMMNLIRNYLSEAYQTHRRFTKLFAMLTPNALTAQGSKLEVEHHATLTVRIEMPWKFHDTGNEID